MKWNPYKASAGRIAMLLNLLSTAPRWDHLKKDKALHERDLAEGCSGCGYEGKPLKTRHLPHI